LDNSFYNFHEVLRKNNVEVNVINVTLKLNVRHTATADPRTEIKHIKHDELINDATIFIAIILCIT